MQLAGPLDPLTMGGISHAIMGTLMQISMALSLAVPLGITTAVFLNEIGGKFARFVRTISDAMTALPSIVAGLFVYAAIITLITHQRSGFAAAMAIMVMMLPIIIRASDVVLRLVAGNLREASYALGSTKWRTVWHVVLPTARSRWVTTFTRIISWFGILPESTNLAPISVRFPRCYRRKFGTFSATPDRVVGWGRAIIWR